MNIYRILCATCLFAGLLYTYSAAQFDREYDPWPVVEGDTLALPFWGGVNDPKPTLTDFDGDVLHDLFIGEIRGKLSYLRNVPLFLFTLLGGWFLRLGMTALGLGDLIDTASIKRIVAIAMEFLIVAAIASLRIEVVAAYSGPLALL